LILLASLAKLGPRPHYHDRDCQLPDDTIDVSRDVAIPLKPGGAMFFSGLLWHGTPPNTSQSRRQAMQFHYCTTIAAQMSKEEIIEMYHDADGFAGCQGWDIQVPGRPIALRARAF
jgi:phytanoyl-CoA hydroxylase